MKLPHKTFIHTAMLAYAAFFTCAVPAMAQNSAEIAYAAAAEPKALLIVKGASHVDLYENKTGKIPSDKMADFFGKNLK